MLTEEKLLGVEQFARLLLLQLVGFIQIRSQRSFPVHAALAQALGVQPVRHHPQKHTPLQYIREHLSSLPMGLGVGERKQDDFRLVVRAWG